MSPGQKAAGRRRRYLNNRFCSARQTVQTKAALPYSPSTPSPVAHTYTLTLHYLSGEPTKILRDLKAAVAAHPAEFGYKNARRMSPAPR